MAGGSAGVCGLIDQLAHPQRVADLAAAVAEVELGQVPRQMMGRDVMMGSVECRLSWKKKFSA